MTNEKGEASASPFSYAFVLRKGYICLLIDADIDDVKEA